MRRSLCIRLGRSLVTLLVAMVGADRGMAAGGVPSFPDFSSTQGLSLNGTAQQVGNVLRLSATSEFNAAASAWFDTPLSLSTGFETIFHFRITPGTLYRDEAADGLTFTIQNAGLDALGLPGHAIGYGGIPASLAVEFDTFLNNDAGTALYGDPNGNHLSVHTRGLEPNSGDEIFSLGSSTAIPVLDDAQVHTARISYAPGTLAIFLDGASTPDVSVSVNLANLLAAPRAFFGFTAASGAATSDHDILSWSLTQVPEPGTGSLIAFGVVLLACQSRGRRRRPIALKSEAMASSVSVLGSGTRS
jgi:hypothetical protein